MVFRIYFTKRGYETRDDSIDYILHEVKDVFAARGLYEDTRKTLEILKNNANAFNFCESEELEKRGIRKVHLKKYKYKIFYHIKNGSEVWVDAVLHDMQDFESILKNK